MAWDLQEKGGALAKVIAKAIHRIRDIYSIHVFSRQHSGKHDNSYVKVYHKQTNVGKYLISENKWDGNVTISASIKAEIEEWIKNNLAYVKESIKEMG